MQFNLFIILLLAAFLISLGLAVFTGIKRKDPVKTELFMVMLAITVWCSASLLEALFTDLGIKIIFTKISYIGIVTSPVFFFLFISRYTNLDRWVTGKNRIFLLVVPAITFLMAATNELHGLVWPDIYLKQNNIAGVFAFYEHGLWYWFNIAYSYAFLLGGIAMLVFSFTRNKHFYSLQSRVLIFASFSPLIGNIIYSFHQTGLEGIDITPLFFTISGVFLTFAIFRYHLFDITPVAREAVTENLYDGVLLVNREDIIIDLNLAACKLLSISNMDIGKRTGEVLSGYKEILALLDTSRDEKKTIREIEIKDKKLYIELRTTLLTDNRGRVIGTIIILRDITSKKIAEKKLKESQNLLLNIINFLPDATFAVDDRGMVIAWNKALEDLSGVKKEDILGKGDYEYSLVIYGEKRPALLDYIIDDSREIDKRYKVLEKKGKNLIAEVEVNLNGKDIQLWLAASPLMDSNNNIIGAIESIRNITNIKKIEKELRHISFHDKLTGLYNRAYFEEEVKRLNKSRQLPLSIIIADINGLKLVNDAFGHDMGDRLLKKAASVIKKYCRSEDIIARWGGDEFSIVLNSTGEKEALEVIDRIQSACERARFKIPVSISMGSETKTNPHIRIEGVLKKAEDSMYRNKLLSSKRVQNSIVDSLTRTLFEKNIETEASSGRVVRMSKKLGERLGLPENKMEELTLHAKLHDIGKVAVNEKLLRKKSALDREEWEEVKKHTEIGYRIANTSTILSPIAEYILCQHEWWDGTGYPRNLRGDEIPIISRIVSIVDAYEAMVTDRPYRKPLTREEAVRELKRSAGTQFDPRLIDEFLSLLDGS